MLFDNTHMQAKNTKHTGDPVMLVCVCALQTFFLFVSLCLYLRMTESSAQKALLNRTEVWQEREEISRCVGRAVPPLSCAHPAARIAFGTLARAPKTPKTQLRGGGGNTDPFFFLKHRGR